jgi:hypothetical protein
VEDLVDEALLVFESHGLLAEMSGFARLGHGSCLFAGLCICRRWIGAHHI